MCPVTFEVFLRIMSKIHPLDLLNILHILISFSSKPSTQHKPTHHVYTKQKRESRSKLKEKQINKPGKRLKVIPPYITARSYIICISFNSTTLHMAACTENKTWRIKFFPPRVLRARCCAIIAFFCLHALHAAHFARLTKTRCSHVISPFVPNRILVVRRYIDAYLPVSSHFCAEPGCFENFCDRT